jgi:lipid-binding SYLF domain-containing protein
MLPGTALLALALCGGALRAGGRETSTVESAAEVLHDLAATPLPCIPSALMQDAKGVAILPHVLKAGFLVGGRYGRGVILVRQRDGTWSNPIFITLAGGGVGFQAGVQSTDVVLVFKTTQGLDRILSGRDKLTLGADVAVAAGPVGRQAEASTDGQLRAEIYSYSRSRGLFAGVSLEGAGILMDGEANEAYYHVRGGDPASILSGGAVAAPLEAVNLKGELARLSMPWVSPPLVSPPAGTASPPPSVAPLAPPSPSQPR